MTDCHYSSLNCGPNQHSFWKIELRAGKTAVLFVLIEMYGRRDDLKRVDVNKGLVFFTGIETEDCNQEVGNEMRISVP